MRNWSGCSGTLLAVLAQPQGLLSIHQQEAEHHLDAQKQRMEVPIDGRLVQQLNMIAGRNAAEGRPYPCGTGSGYPRRSDHNRCSTEWKWSE